MMERQGRRAVSTVEDLVEGPEFRAFPEAAGEANVWRTICLIHDYLLDACNEGGLCLAIYQSCQRQGQRIGSVGA